METIKLNTFIIWLHISAWAFTLIPVVIVLTSLVGYDMYRTYIGYLHLPTWIMYRSPLLVLATLFSFIVFGFRLKGFFKSGRWYSLILPLLLIPFAVTITWFSFFAVGLVGGPGSSVPIPQLPSDHVITAPNSQPVTTVTDVVQVAASSYQGSTERTSIYQKDDDGIYYFDGGADGSFDKVYLQGVDYDTFTRLSTVYVKDKNNVYYYADKIIGADPTTFEVFPSQASEVFARDNTSVYFRGGLLKEADPSTFRILNESYTKDTNHVYVYGVRNESMDALTFEVFSSSAFTKDKRHVYYAGVIFPNVDPATFGVLSLGYSKDKDHAYWNNKVIERADVETFRVVGQGNGTFYAKDKNNVYQAGVLMSNVNPNTFIIP